MNEIRYFKKKIAADIKKLTQLKKKVERQLKKAPEGKLVISSSNGSKQFFHKKKGDSGKGKYLDKTNNKLIRALAQKEYEEKLVKETEKRIKQLNRINEWLQEKGMEEVYENLSVTRKELVVPQVLPDDQYIKQWLDVEYKGRPFLDAAVSFLTEKGERVRSKSEKIIADKLYAMGIPYRYEYPLELKGERVIYPDFTLLDVANRREVYLEHLGLMDNADYCNKTILKLQSLARHGIFLGKNLLLTFETKQNPLNIIYLEELLKEHIL